jgi:hypothetical protein
MVWECSDMTETPLRLMINSWTRMSIMTPVNSPKNIAFWTITLSPITFVTLIPSFVWDMIVGITIPSSLLLPTRLFNSFPYDIPSSWPSHRLRSLMDVISQCGPRVSICHSDEQIPLLHICLSLPLQNTCEDIYDHPVTVWRLIHSK